MCNETAFAFSCRSTSALNQQPLNDVRTRIKWESACMAIRKIHVCWQTDSPDGVAGSLRHLCFNHLRLRSCRHWPFVCSSGSLPGRRHAESAWHIRRAIAAGRDFARFSHSAERLQYCLKRCGLLAECYCGSTWLPGLPDGMAYGSKQTVGFHVELGGWPGKGERRNRAGGNQ